MEYKDLPAKYLGYPIYMGKKLNVLFVDLIRNILSKIVGWHSKLLSKGGSASLIKHVVLALPVHVLASIYPTKGSIHQIERGVNKLAILKNISSLVLLGKPCASI